MGKELDVRLEIHMQQHIDDMRAFKETMRDISELVNLAAVENREIKQQAIQKIHELYLHYQRAEQVGRKALRLWRDE